MEVQEEDDRVKLCQSGLLPKLPFLIENRDEASLREYFRAPAPTGNEEGETLPPPLSTFEREKILTGILDRFQKEGLEWWGKLSPKSRAYVCLFLGENHDGSKPWSGEGCESIVRKICKNVSLHGTEVVGDLKRSPEDLKTWFVTNFEESLKWQETDFHHILQLSRAKFTKSDWKYFPANVHGFVWIVKQIPSPFLSNGTDVVIPPALLFTDDYFDDNRMLGLECLSHVVHNVDRKDLTQSNWALVIYDAVLPKCSEKDPAVIEMVVPILIKVLSVTEKDPAECSSEFTKYDNVLKEIIYVIDVCSDVNVKRSWLPLLDEYLKKMGSATLHWSDKLCSMLRDATVCNDYALWISILQVTSTVIKNTWMKPDCRGCSEIILRVLFNSACFHIDTPEDVRRELAKNAEHCLELLEKCEGFDDIKSQLQEVVDQGERNLIHPDFIQVLKNVLHN